jgi:ATP-dependent protease ClpP protease subunit
MYDALINSKSVVSVNINGLAASAASFLAQAASPGKLKISEPGRMMIHDAQGIGIGGPADMQEYTDLLHSVSNDIAGIYAKRAGGETKAWRKAMSATTWYNSQQAIDNKLADSTIGNKGPDNRTKLIQARNRVLVGGK